MEEAREEEIEVKSLINGSRWKESAIEAMVTPDMEEYITKEIHLRTDGLNDKAWWLGSPNGVFSVKSAYQLVRNRRNKVEWHEYVWSRWVPQKISFFLWRVINMKVPTDDVLKIMGISVVSRCGCCDTRVEETVNHIFLTAPITQRL